jgi:stage II sporulation protein D
MSRYQTVGHRCALLLLVLLVATSCTDTMTGPDLADGRLSPTGAAVDVLASLQATPPGFIRIGVVPSATEITLGAADEFSVINKATGEALFTGTDGSLVVELLAAGEVRIRAWLQITCTGSEATRDALMAAGLAAGFEVDSEDLGSCTRVMYGSLPPNPDAAARTAFQQQLAAAGLTSTGFWWSARTTVIGETQIQVTDGATDVLISAPVVLESADGLVTINGNRYRGVAEVWTNSGGTLAGINELPLEQYLYGVVPRELPPGPYGLPEAQKAQAVTARTYALANMGKRGTDGYDLLPTTSDQVYGGYGAEHPVSTAAVDETTGVVAVHNGVLITTLYHSTSGGWTANSEDVFITPLPYLRGVPDAERGQALERVPSVEVFMRHANPTNLRARAEGEFESDWSQYHRWKVDWTVAEMAEVLAASLVQPITDVSAVRVLERADHGRVLRIEFVTDAGTFHATKDGIRSILRYLDANGNHAPLRSTLFHIEPTRNPGSRGVTGWKAYGGGWGHGVGMSQTGAVGMAERGRTYEEILRHYYRGIELEVRD